MKLYAAIDLHSTNSVVCVIDEQDVVKLKPQRLKNEAALILEVLAPFQQDIQSVTVESTFNWYWLVDALEGAGYTVKLAHAAAVPQYAGLKHGDDDSDALHLAHLLRLGILPTGTICPQPIRALRDLMRRRHSLVQQQTRDVLILKSMFHRVLGDRVSVAKLDRAAIRAAFPQQADRCAAVAVWETLQGVQRTVDKLERWIRQRLRRLPPMIQLKSMSGIGDILGPTILLETGDIKRFASVGNYVSYCRLVDSKRLSNGKVKGHGNRKSGNKHLCWAWIEVANVAIRCNKTIECWYDRKLKAVKMPVIAKKAVAHKCARAGYFMMRDGTDFDADRAFG